MRHLFSVILLTAVLGIGSLRAVDLTPSSTQTLIQTAQNLPISGSGSTVEVTVRVGTSDVVMVVSRDKFGNVIARPKVGQSNVNISQISIQTTVDGSGKLVPKSMLVIDSKGTITSFALSMTGGTLNQTQSGSFAANTSGQNQPRGQVENSATTSGGTGQTTHTEFSAWLGAVTGSSDSNSLALPAGAGTTQVSGSLPE
jgi:hypothetical protein